MSKQFANTTTTANLGSQMFARATQPTSATVTGIVPPQQYGTIYDGKYKRIYEQRINEDVRW